MADRLIVREQSDGRVAVALQRAGQLVAEPAGEPIEFSAPLDAAAREDLRWYLEDYLTAPFGVYEERGPAIAGRLSGWGEALFEALFGAGKPGRDAYLTARAGPAELVLVSDSAGFLALPWELLKDPKRPTPLALEIKEALSNRPGMTMTYGQLGLLSEKRGSDQEALDWMVRCVALFAEFPHPATGPGPRHLARLTAKLGMAALEDSWRRSTGAALPAAIGDAVAEMIEDMGDEEK